MCLSTLKILMPEQPSCSTPIKTNKPYLMITIQIK